MHICRICTEALTPEEEIAINNDKNLTGHHVTAKSRKEDQIKDPPEEKKCKGPPPAANVFSLIHRSRELILFDLNSGQPRRSTNTNDAVASLAKIAYPRAR